MTITTRFFSDGTEYNQPDFAKLMKDSLADGYIYGVGTGCAVVQTTTPSMTVNVGLGRLYIQGFSMDVESSVYSITLSASDATNPRIDRIVARLSATTNKTITLEKLTGTPASSPVAPSLTQGSDTYEISLAQIYVGAGVGIITSANITDERLRARPITHNVAHAKNGTDELYLDGTQITTGTVSSDRIGRASTSAYGVVKIGDGITVSDGVLSVEYGSYPMMARLYTTDQGYGGYFILANVYQGTLGTKQSGLIYQNDTATTTRSLTFTATATNTSASGSSSTYTFTFKAKDVLTLVERTLGTASGSGDGGTVKTHSVTYDVKLTEIITYSFSASQSYWSSSISAPNNNIYLGRPT